jgi:predicted metal-dependent phosphoesterase TrpH
VPTEKWQAAEVLAAVHEAGGVCSLAHSVWYRDIETLLAGLAAHGLDAVEVFHPDHGPDEEERFGKLARNLGLAVTAGSDFHGAVEGKKAPGGVYGDGAMLETLRARRPR